MSLAEKFEEYAKQDADICYETTEAMMKAAFYAGAEAYGRELEEMPPPIIPPRILLQAELDRFKGQK